MKNCEMKLNGKNSMDSFMDKVYNRYKGEREEINWFGEYRDTISPQRHNF